MSSLMDSSDKPNLLSGQQINRPIEETQHPQQSQQTTAPVPQLPPALQPIDVRKESNENQTAPAYVPLEIFPKPFGGKDETIRFDDPNFRAGLPQRDYPSRPPDARQLDKAAFPTYVPEPRETTYPDEYMRRLRGADPRRRARLFETDTSLLIEQLQIPIMLGLLFFVFSMPFAHELLRRQFGTMLPIANEDTTLNVNGRALLSVLFTAAVHFGFGCG